MGTAKGEYYFQRRGKKGEKGKRRDSFGTHVLCCSRLGRNGRLGNGREDGNVCGAEGENRLAERFLIPLCSGMSQKGPRANLEEGKVPWRKIDMLSSSFRGDWDLFCFLADARHRLISDRWFVRRGSSLPQGEFIGGGGV